MSVVRVIFVGVLFLAFACTSGGTGGQADTAPQADLTGDLGDDGYPAGPYGKEEGQPLANLSFFDPASAAQVSLRDLRGGEARVLMITSSAGWCGACLQEAVVMNSIEADWAPRGLYILYTLFQDWNGGEADEGFWTQWCDQTDPTYRVVLDPDFVLGNYFNPDSAPLNLLVDLETMKILRLETGFNREALEAALDALLPAQNEQR
jgi:hypothetical protein